MAEPFTMLTAHKLIRELDPTTFAPGTFTSQRLMDILDRLNRVAYYNGRDDERAAEEQRKQSGGRDHGSGGAADSQA